jgi:hypothetical protein
MYSRDRYLAADADGVASVDPETQSRIGLTEMIEEGDASFGDVVAAVTESPLEAEIDKRNGLHHHRVGRRPVQSDFDGLLTPEGISGDVVGSDISDEPFALGETGSTGGTKL